MANRLPVIALWFLVTFIASAVHAVPVETTLEPVEAMDFPNIQSTINVSTPKPITGDLKDLFTLYEDGKKVEKWDCTLDARPMYVSLILDRSGSMNNSMAWLKKAAADFVSLMGKTAYCQLISFSDTVKEEYSFSSNTNQLRQKIAVLKPYGATALYDALSRAVDSLRFYPSSCRRVIVVFTDGRDQNAEGTARQSSVNAKDVVIQARNHGLPVYTIGLGSKISTKLLGKMATLTGGRFYHSPDEKNLISIFRELASTLRVSYSFNYVTPNPKKDGTTRKLSVVSMISGTSGQAKGAYKAPSEPIKAAGNLPAGTSEANSNIPSDKLRTVLSNVFGSGKFGTDFTREVSNWSATPKLDYPVVSNLNVNYDGTDHNDIKHSSTIKTTMNKLSGEVSNIHVDGKNVLSIKPPKIPRFSLNVQGPGVSHSTSFALMLPENVVETVVPLPALSGVSPQTSVDSMLSSIHSYGTIRLAGGDCIEISPNNPENQTSRLFFNETTMLPVKLVNSLPQKGSQSVTTYNRWFRDVTVPQPPKVLSNVQVDTNAATQLAGNIALTANANLGQMTTELTKLGPSLQLMATNSVETSLKSIETFNKAFAASMQQFDKNMEEFDRNLQQNLAAMEKGYEKQLQAFLKNLDTNLEQLDKNIAAMTKAHETMAQRYVDNAEKLSNHYEQQAQKYEANVNKTVNDIHSSINKTLSESKDPTTLGEDISNNVNQIIQDSGITDPSGWGVPSGMDTGASGWNDNGSSSWSDNSDDSGSSWNSDDDNDDDDNDDDDSDNDDNDGGW